MEYITYIVSGFLFIRICVVIYNLITRPLLTERMPAKKPGVSILIPVRNEENNIDPLIKNLQEINYPSFEILLLDDQSTDHTAQCIKKYTKHRQIRYLEGAPLPAGWLGKNWACHQLSKAAQGDYWLFIDADVRLHPEAINSAITEIQEKKLALFTVFPDQCMLTLPEKIIVPMMHYILVSLLPLRRVYKSKFSSLSAANGQFMLFDKNLYMDWHRQVKNQIIEDIAIMRTLKKTGLKGEVLLGNELIKCRMYQGLKESLQGFSKNILAGFGNSSILLIIYIFLISLGYLSFLFSPSPLLYFIIPGILLLRGGISYLAHQPVGKMLLLHPLQIMAMLIISIRSVYQSKTKKISWKDRNISQKA